MDVSTLSTHDLAVAAAHLFLTGGDSPVGTSLPRRRRVAKGPAQQSACAERTYLLGVFALAAWIEMTERWADMPHNPTQHLQKVNNLTPFEFRQLCWDVHEEFAFSSKPLFDHCCATCGRLLYFSRGGEPAHRVGVPGPPCQIRGSTVDWTDMPLCLLLWSTNSDLCP